MRGRRPIPACVGCSRERDAVSLMLGLRHGGMSTYLCADCVRDLYAVVRAAEPDVKPLDYAALIVVDADRIVQFPAKPADNTH